MDSELSTEEKLQQLTKLIGPESQPNINALWEIAKDLNAVKLNLKFFGYELAKTLAAALPEAPTEGPFEIELNSKASTQQDLESDWTRYWSAQLKMGHVFHRKIWELAYALQTIWQNGHMKAGARGLGFGCGEEALPSYLASKGCRITVTDLPPDDRHVSGWAETHQYATLDKAYHSEFLDRASYDDRVDFRHVDMNAIPNDLRDYDFCWSICAFEHLGSIEKGMNFIDNAMDTLRPGGLSIHTTEFNFFDESETIDNWGTVLYQRRHFEEMARRLTAKGHYVAPFDFDVGSKPLDKFIDLPPYDHDWPNHMRDIWAKNANHIKLNVDGFPVTCFGIIAIKG